MSKPQIGPAASSQVAQAILAQREPALVPTLCVDIPRAALIVGGVSEWTVRAWISNGDLPVIKLPGVRRGETSRRVLIAVKDLEAFVVKHRAVNSA